MPQYTVWLHSESKISSDMVDEFLVWFNGHGGPIQIRRGEADWRLPTNSVGELTWDSIFRRLAENRMNQSLGVCDFQFLMTTTSNEANWYSADNPDCPLDGFGHIADFSWATNAPTRVLISHYILKSISNAILHKAGYKLEDVWHTSESRGCFNDFCAEKRDLDLKLRTADICGDCVEVFSTIAEFSSLLPQFVSIMESGRLLSVNTSIYSPQKESFQAWPFPVAITRHRAVIARDPLIRLLKLLDHFDSLVRYVALTFAAISGQDLLVPTRPSLGWWVDSLNQLLSGNVRQNNFEKAIRAAHRIACQNQIVQLRNERRGHGWIAANQEDYMVDCQSLERSLSAIEEVVRPILLRHELVICRETELVEGSIVIRGDRLTGSQTIHPTFETQFASNGGRLPRNENEVNLWDRAENHFIRLHPSIRELRCPECRFNRILITDGENTYIDVEIGHRVQISP
jgi:hypothetical protein